MNTKTSGKLVDLRGLANGDYAIVFTVNEKPVLQEKLIVVGR